MGKNSSFSKMNNNVEKVNLPSSKKIDIFLLCGIVSSSEGEEKSIFMRDGNSDSIVMAKEYWGGGSTAERLNTMSTEKGIVRMNESPEKRLLCRRRK
jgi:hypothetical protein